MKRLRKVTKRAARWTLTTFTGMASEASIQAALIEHWQQRGEPDSIVAAVPNGELRDKATAIKLQKQGVLPGFPDLIVCAKGAASLVEVKRLRGRLSRDLENVHAVLRRIGIPVYVVNNLDDGLELLEELGALRRSSASVRLASHGAEGNNAAELH